MSSVMANQPYPHWERVERLEITVSRDGMPTTSFK